MAHRVFLLSPASTAGKRCQQLLARGASFELARRLRREGAPIGEVMSFLSSLYFRGKLAYARRFATPPAGCPGVLVITADRGLVHPELSVRMRDVRAFGRVPIEAGERRYAEPLRESALALRKSLPRDHEVVLLGSIATQRYVGVLLGTFERSLRFPVDFVGRGDMSRGGLMLRAVRAGVELEYGAVDGAVRRGPRAVRLSALEWVRAPAH